MKLGLRQAIYGAMGLAVVCLLGATMVRAQATPDGEPPMAEDVFLDVQVLRGITADEFMGTMGIFSAALGMSCEDCHAAGDADWAGFAEDTERKQVARMMVLMMNAINRANFGDEQMVTCYSCHRGTYLPATTANLDVLYGAIIPENPYTIFEQAPFGPSADEVLDRYIEALGGAERLATLTSFVATGTSEGYGPEGDRPAEVYARAPDQRTVILRTVSGDNVRTYDGRNAWAAIPFQPIPVLARAGDELEGARLEAELLFPGRIKDILGDWRVGFPTTIDDRRVQVVQGTSAGGLHATFYLDSETGLLTRWVRYADSVVGRMATRIDYADYRDVSGIMMPFHWTITWLGGREIIELEEIELNVPIDDARFARPAPPEPVAP